MSVTDLAPKEEEEEEEGWVFNEGSANFTRD
jgi:hypothetical protein